MNPLVSIILPTHNGQQFISQSIESCLNQTYKNIELIIVDDASTDDTPQIIKHYSQADSRIKIITNQKNQKLPKSLNIGHKASSGEFITWTSDDNYYREDAIEKMVDYLQSNNEVGMVYCDFTSINVNSAEQKIITVPTYLTLSESNCVGSCFLYRREVFKQIGYYSHKTLLAEDYDYWLRVATRFQLFPLHEQLYFYRRHEYSLTAKSKNGKVRQAKEIALSRSLRYLPWLSKKQKFDKSMVYLFKALSRRDWRVLSNYIPVAFLLSPIQMMRLIFLRLLKIH